MRNKKINIYRILLLLNTLIIFTIIFLSENIYIVSFGIVILIFSFYYRHRVRKSNFYPTEFQLKKYNIKYAGIESLIFGVLGFKGMFFFQNNLNWTLTYFAVFNLFIISNFYLKVSRSK